LLLPFESAHPINGVMKWRGNIQRQPRTRSKKRCMSASGEPSAAAAARRSPEKQAIAIGLSKARRAGKKVPRKKSG
jgi:Family of unknown function (DUF6496)